MSVNVCQRVSTICPVTATTQVDNGVRTRHPDGVPNRDWKRLKGYVVARRREIGYEQRKAFTDAIRLSYNTVGKIERGEPVGPEVLAVLEEFLLWTPGDIGKILDEGGTPTVRTATPDTNGPAEAVQSLSFNAQLRMLYQLLGEEEYVRTCLRIGRGDQGAESQPEKHTARTRPTG